GRLFDGEWAGYLRLVRQRPLLRLPEGQHALAVGVAEIVGDRVQRRLVVGLIAEILAHGPGAGATSEAAVEQVQPGLDQPLVGLALDLEARAGLATIQLAVA